MSIILEHKEDKITIEMSEGMMKMYQYYMTNKSKFTGKHYPRYKIYFKDNDKGYYEVYYERFFAWLKLLINIQPECTVTKEHYIQVKYFLKKTRIPPLSLQMLTWKRTEIIHYHLNSDILFVYK